MHCEECGNAVYQAGETVPAGVYMRIDDGSLRRVALTRPEPLPASFDGHIATYRSAASACACERRHARRLQVVGLAASHQQQNIQEEA